MIEKLSIQIVFPPTPKSIFYVCLEPGHVGYALESAQMAAVCVCTVSIRAATVIVCTALMSLG